MFAWVSVITMALPASLAVIDVSIETSGCKSLSNWGASTNRTGMIWVTILSVIGILSGSAPDITGMPAIFASSRAMMLSVLPFSTAASLFWMRTVLRRLMASSLVNGSLLMTVTLPLIDMPGLTLIMN